MEMEKSGCLEVFQLTRFHFRFDKLSVADILSAE